VRVFLSYDREHDEDLCERLDHQLSESSSEFEISARSADRAVEDHWDDTLRREIRGADQVLVLCGEHTEGSQRVGAEVRIAQEEERPYTLLWGRRERMCTKPTTARTVDAMYSWTWEILQAQILMIRHAVQRRREAPRKPSDRVPESQPA